MIPYNSTEESCWTVYRINFGKFQRGDHRELGHWTRKPSQIVHFQLSDSHLISANFIGRTFLKQISKNFKRGSPSHSIPGNFKARILLIQFRETSKREPFLLNFVNLQRSPRHFRKQSDYSLSTPKTQADWSLTRKPETDWSLNYETPPDSPSLTFRYFKGDPS